MIKIVSIGTKNESWVQEGINHFQKRLRAPFDINWVLLRPAAQEGLKARQKDSETIINQLKPTDFVILLDELGENMTSQVFSDFLNDKFTNSKDIVFVIGGSYGVDTLLKQRSDKILSLSSFVFPHQFARLILTEQIYRAQEIALGNPYHHA